MFISYLKCLVCIGLMTALSGCTALRNKDKEGPDKDEPVGRYIDNTVKMTKAIFDDSGLKMI